MICPNCKHEMAEGEKRCVKCGNPLVEGRPWDKGAMLKEEPGDAEEKSSVESPEKVLKVRYQHREGGKFARYMSTQEKEWCIQDEFVIKVGYGCYTLDPAAPDELKEGTVLLSKKYLYFGDSEHALRCGRFDVEIPVELIDYVTDATYRGKSALLVQLKTGEGFVIFAMKIKEWRQHFQYVTEYRPSSRPAQMGGSAQGNPSGTSRGKTVFHMIAAVAMFAIAAVLRADTFMMTLFILMGCGFLLLVAIALFGKKK